MSIAVVTDSTADIPGELAERFGIHVVPNVLIVAGQSLVDGRDISREEFYQRLPEMNDPPTTATASPGTYQHLYEKLIGDGFSQIVSIHTSRLLSGIYNAASAAAYGFGGCVHVIDSGTVTLGLGFQALAAAESAARGATLEAVLSLLEDLRPRARVIAILDTLEYVRRSGRVSWARARLGDLLRIKPFVAVKEGVVHSLGEARTHRKGIEMLRRFLLEQGPLERLAMLHTNAEAEARQILDQVLNELSLQLPHPPLVVNVTTVIGAHVGPNALGFAAVVK